MTSVFDMERLNEMLRDFYVLTKIRITVYDGAFRELTSYPEPRARVCRMIRENPAADAACVRCDRAACLAAAEKDEPYVYACHAGLTEAITPLRADAAIAGYLCFGHLFPYATRAEGWEAIRARLAAYRFDEGALRAACDELPLVSQSYILSAAHILHAVASLLVTRRAAVLANESVEETLDRYLSEHCCEPLKASALCERFSIGKTKLYEIVRRNYGRGLAEYLRDLRIGKAKKLLSEYPSLSVSEVAVECGYGDYNYFITCFTRATGLSPKKYQRAFRESARRV